MVQRNSPISWSDCGAVLDPFYRPCAWTLAATTQREVSTHGELCHVGGAGDNHSLTAHTWSGNIVHYAWNSFNKQTSLQPRSQGLSSSPLQGAGRWETLGTRLTSLFTRSVLPPLERDVGDSTRKIPYWWRSSTEIRVASLIGCYLRAKIDNRATVTNQRHYTGLCYVTRGENWAREESSRVLESLKTLVQINSSPGRGHCVLFLGKIVPLSSQEYKWIPANC